MGMELPGLRMTARRLCVRLCGLMRGSSYPGRQSATCRAGSFDEEFVDYAGDFRAISLGFVNDVLGCGILSAYQPGESAG